MRSFVRAVLLIFAVTKKHGYTKTEKEEDPSEAVLIFAVTCYKGGTFCTCQ